MEKIEEIFKKKNFDKETIGLIENFINEFDDLFGKYVPREEVIQRINQNLDKVEFVETCSAKNATGVYKTKDKKIEILNRLKEENIGSTFFHEMLHCITSNEKGSGFDREYSVENDFWGKDKIIVGVGINEGITQYLTEIRDEKYSKDNRYHSYPILVQQVQKLMEFIEKENLINDYFNDPQEILTLIDENFEYETGITILSIFDVIKDEEKSLVNNTENRLFRAMGYDPKSEKLKNRLEHLQIIFCDKLLENGIKSDEELIAIIKRVKEYANQLKMHIPLTVLDRIYSNAEENNLDLNTIIDKEGYDQLVLHLDVEKFCNKDTNGKLNAMLSDECPGTYDFQRSLKHQYESRMMSSLFYNLDNIDGEWFDDFEYPLAKVILDKGYDFYKLQIEKSYDDSIDIYDLYYYDDNKKQKEHLNTILHDYYSSKTKTELEKVDENEKEQIVKKYPQLKDDEDNLVMFKDEGHLLIREKDSFVPKVVISDDEYIEIDEDDLSKKTLKSVDEMATKKMDEWEKRINRLWLEFNAPLIALRDQYCIYLSKLKEFPIQIFSDKIQEVQKKIEKLNKELLKESPDLLQEITDLASEKSELAEKDAEAKALVGEFEGQVENNQKGQSMNDDE